MQEQRKNARKSNRGGMKNTCGSLSISTHALKMVCFIFIFLILLKFITIYILTIYFNFIQEQKTGKKPSAAEVFKVTHTKKNPDTGGKNIWVKPRAESTYVSIY